MRLFGHGSVGVGMCLHDTEVWDFEKGYPQATGASQSKTIHSPSVYGTENTVYYLFSFLEYLPIHV